MLCHPSLNNNRNMFIVLPRFLESKEPLLPLLLLLHEGDELLLFNQSILQTLQESKDYYLFGFGFRKLLFCKNWGGGISLVLVTFLVVDSSCSSMSMRFKALLSISSFSGGIVEGLLPRIITFSSSSFIRFIMMK